MSFDSMYNSLFVSLKKMCLLKANILFYSTSDHRLMRLAAGWHYILFCVYVKLLDFAIVFVYFIVTYFHRCDVCLL